MGCASGALLLNGPYMPEGAPICYLLSGSHVVVANLWTVNDRDMSLFCKKLLDAWIKERNGLVDGNVSTSTVGSYMGETRHGCHFKNLMGAATVYYGVPTHIIKKIS